MQNNNNNNSHTAATNNTTSISTQSSFLYSIYVHVENDDKDDVDTDASFDVIRQTHIGSIHVHQHRPVNGNANNISSTSSSVSPNNKHENPFGVLYLEQEEYEHDEREDVDGNSPIIMSLPEPRSLSPLFGQESLSFSENECNENMGVNDVTVQSSASDLSRSSDDDENSILDDFLCIEDADYLTVDNDKNGNHKLSSSSLNLIGKNNKALQNLNQGEDADISRESDHKCIDGVDVSNKSTDCLVNFMDIPATSRVKIRKFKLMPKDEVHVSPCQCALKFMAGIQGNDKNECPPMLKSKKQIGLQPDTSKANLEHIFVDVSYDLQCSSSFNNDSSPFRQRPSRSVEKLYDKDLCLKTDLEDRKALQKAHVDYKNDQSMLSDHEITIIRCNDEGSDGDINNYVEIEFENWSIITIRCNTHEELDNVVQALRTHVQGIKVIPFSYEVKDKKRKHRRKRSISLVVSAFIITCISPTIIFNLIKLNFLSQQSPRTKSAKFFWKNSDLCEYCQSNFTLLTRRRKFDLLQDHKYLYFLIYCASRSLSKMSCECV